MFSNSRLLVVACFALGLVSSAYAELVEVKCPVVADRQTGKYSAKKAKYRCFKNKTSAKKSGFSQHSFLDDSSSCAGSGGSTPSPSPSASPTPSDFTLTPGDYNLTGPGQRSTVVFAMSNGGSVSYLFPGGGEFEIKVFNANTDKKVQDVLETLQASSGTLSLSAQSVPVFVKVEGPGAWQVAVSVN